MKMVLTIALWIIGCNLQMSLWASAQPNKSTPLTHDDIEIEEELIVFEEGELEEDDFE